MTLVEDIQKLRQDLEKVRQIAENNASIIGRHEEQISGRRGLAVTLEELATEIKSLRKAAYWVGGLIVAGSITFAFSVMALIGA